MYVIIVACVVLYVSVRICNPNSQNTQTTHMLHAHGEKIRLTFVYILCTHLRSHIICVQIPPAFVGINLQVRAV